MHTICAILIVNEPMSYLEIYNTWYMLVISCIIICLSVVTYCPVSALRSFLYVCVHRVTILLHWSDNVRNKKNYLSMRHGVCMVPITQTYLYTGIIRYNLIWLCNIISNYDTIISYVLNRSVLSFGIWLNFSNKFC